VDEVVELTAWAGGAEHGPQPRPGTGRPLAV